MRFTAATCVLAMVTGTALGADYRAAPALVAAEPAPPVETFSWGGLYGGIHGAYSTANYDYKGLAKYLTPDTLASFPYLNDPAIRDFLTFGRNSADRYGVGGFIGVNAELDGAVLGLEADITRADFHIRHDKFTIDTSGTFEDRTLTTGSAYYRNKISDYGILKARVGYGFGPVLPWLSVGLAVARSEGRAHADYEAVRIQRVAAVDAFGQPATAELRTVLAKRHRDYKHDPYTLGLALGGGIDYAVLPHVLLRAEYQHVNFSDMKGSSPTLHSVRFGAGVKY